LCGRHDELATIDRLRRTPGVAAVVLTGARGAGTSRVLSEAVRRARAAGDAGALVAVDHADELDHASAALVRQQIVSGRAFLIATVRSAGEAPEPIAALIEGGRAHRVEIRPLSRPAVEGLLAGVLGGPLAPSAASELLRRAGGNLAVLRRIVTDGRAAGTLLEVGGFWHWRASRPGRPEGAERAVVELLIQPAAAWTTAARLTPRERAVVTLAASGLSNREVADRLFVSLRTVENHLYRAFPKLGVSSRRELLAWAGDLAKGA
jgi:DNA-binding CsgD family transcriptional regulator